MASSGPWHFRHALKHQLDMVRQKYLFSVKTVTLRPFFISSVLSPEIEWDTDFHGLDTDFYGLDTDFYGYFICSEKNLKIHENPCLIRENPCSILNTLPDVSRKRRTTQ